MNELLPSSCFKWNFLHSTISSIPSCKPIKYDLRDSKKAKYIGELWKWPCPSFALKAKHELYQCWQGYNVVQVIRMTFKHGKVYTCDDFSTLFFCILFQLCCQFMREPGSHLDIPFCNCNFAVCKCVDRPRQQ